MTKQKTTPYNAILRIKEVTQYTGLSKSTIYERITLKLWPKGVPVGFRAVGWPIYEVEAMNAAAIAGKTEEERHQLVLELEENRKNSETKL